MNCSQRNHPPRPGLPYRQTIPRRERVLCAACVQKLNAMGMDWKPIDELSAARWRGAIPA